MRLQAKYSLSIVFLIVSIVLILVGTLLYQFKLFHNNLTDISAEAMSANLLEQMEKRGEAITRLLAANLTNPLYHYDMVAMFELLSATQQLKDVIYTYVYGPDGKVIHDGKTTIPAFGTPLRDEASIHAITVKGKLITRIQGEVIDVSIPIWIGDTPLGGVKVGMSLSSINSDITYMTNHLSEISRIQLRRNIITAAVTGLGFIGIGILFSFIVATRLIRPIRELIKYAKQVGSGHYTFQISSQYHDEIGDLIYAFNQMGYDLKLNQNALNKAHDELEQRVKERTAELKETTEDLNKKIVERKQIENSLRESEERYRAVVKQASEGIFLLDPNTQKIIEANEAFQSMLGYQPEEIFNLNIYNFIAHDKQDINRNIEKTISKRYHFLDERNYIHKDGTLLSFEVRTNMITFGGRDVLCVVVRDITKQKRIENERTRLELQLQRAQKMEIIGTLAGGVAHDLNNILSGLVSYPELLLMDLPENSPLRKPILTMQRSGEKAAVIVQDLLTLARRGVAITEIVNLNQIIAEYLKSPEHKKLMLSHSEVRIKTDLKKDLFNILGSPVHLFKTVMNLISNAAESMLNGGRISISTENRYIDKAISGYDEIKEGDYAILRVSDSGIGISSADRERIFEPFYTRKVMGRSGTGLGMAVIWGTVKDHNGYINIESTEGVGSTFTIYFPITRENIEQTALTAIEELIGSRETILVVDDVEEQRELASNMLSKLGYSITTVSSGEEAVEYLKSNSADLVILDMIMDPGIDGLDTYKKILELNPEQKAIIVSGFSETDRIKEAQQLGAGQYVSKPYTLEKIGLAVKSEIGNPNGF